MEHSEEGDVEVGEVSEGEGSKGRRGEINRENTTLTKSTKDPRGVPGGKKSRSIHPHPFIHSLHNHC
jgi:hypothetical protein